MFLTCKIEGKSVGRYAYTGIDEEHIPDPDLAVTFDTGVLECPLPASSLSFRAADTVDNRSPPPLRRIPSGAGAKALLDRLEDALQDYGSGGS